MAGAKHPQAGLPCRSALAGSPLKWQYETHRRPETPFENTAKAFALFRVVELVVFRIDIDWELPLGQEISERIFVCTNKVLGIDGQRSGEFIRESLSLSG